MLHKFSSYSINFNLYVHTYSLQTCLSLCSYELISPVTFRDEISGCSEKAYDFLAISDAQKMLLFSSEQELLEYIKEVLIIVNCLYVLLLMISP